VGGAGGIGTWLTFALVSAGFYPIVYDFDVIEQHNLGGQLFRNDDVGSKKVTALYNIIEMFRGHQLHTFDEAVTQQTPTHYFAFSAFDNMKARKDLFEVWKKSIEGCPVTPIFIDGRLIMEQLQIFVVTPDNMDWYEKEHLFDDSEVADAACTMRQTTHSAMMIASHMVGFFTNHMANIYKRNNSRILPRYYEFHIPLTMTTEEFNPLSSTKIEETPLIPTSSDLRDEDIPVEYELVSRELEAQSFAVSDREAGGQVFDNVQRYVEQNLRNITSPSELFDEFRRMPRRIEEQDVIQPPISEPINEEE